MSMRELAENLRQIAIQSHRQEADVLDRVRGQIGRDDVEGWNALLSAASMLRQAAYRLELTPAEQR